MNLYINIKSHDSRRSYDDVIVREINHIGPVYYSEQGRGYTSHDISDSNTNKYLFSPGERVFVVIARHQDGDTFSTTSGLFDVEYICKSCDDAQEWINKNKLKMEKKYGGYFEKLENLEIHCVPFDKDSEIPVKYWF